MMDIMQINIRREQPDFLLEQCVCMVDMEAVFCGKPVFFLQVRGKLPERAALL